MASVNEVVTVEEEPAVPEDHDTSLSGKVTCECVVDNGSEMVVIRRDKWEQTGSRFIPSCKILMETANNSSNWMLGITENLMMTVSGLSVYVQAQVVKDVPYGVLLGWPFLTLLSANMQDHPDSRQDITLTCPETGAKTFIKT